MILDGKTVLVFGAGGRIGSATVGACLAAGAQIVAADTSAAGLADLVAKFGPSARLITVEADITSATALDDLLCQAPSGTVLAGAVNTAYPRNANYGRAFLDVSSADFCENVALHLGGYFLVTQACARYATARNVPFSLVNLSSVYGSIAPRFEIYDNTPMTMPVEYAAIKAGIEHVTRYAAAWAKGSLFRANCVSPGGIAAGQPAAFVERYTAHCVSKGMLDASDVTGTIVYLLSDLSRFVIGQNIIVDDGFAL
jgi:NAD(P)-dependent dehydrogenase (short-subunit alcohol dehydrogenase family)